jgi:thiol peroxidase
MNKIKRTVNLAGNPVELIGNFLEVGQTAPEFQAVDTNMQPFVFSGKRNRISIISAVGSLDTGVCDVETRRFNKEAANLGDQVEVLTISMDLPFAQKRWCAAAGIDRVTVVSDYKDASFGLKYGVLVEQSRLLARAVFVVDREGIIHYIQLVPEITQEPDYDAVITAVKQLL